MIFAFFNKEGRINEAHNDDTLIHLPSGAVELTQLQWDNRFNLRFQAGELINDPIVTQPIEPQSKTQFTSLDFLDRFTEDEQLAVVTATMVSPVVKLWYDRLLAASFIDLEDPRTEGGIDALISAGLVEASRKEALMAHEDIAS